MSQFKPCAIAHLAHQTFSDAFSIRNTRELRLVFVVTARAKVHEYLLEGSPSHR